MGRLVNRKTPFSLDWPARVSPVSVLRTVTVAFGTTDELASWTTPEISWLVVVWQKPAAANRAASARTRCSLISHLPKPKKDRFRPCVPKIWFEYTTIESRRGAWADKIGACRHRLYCSSESKAARWPWTGLPGRKFG